MRPAADGLGWRLASTKVRRAVTARITFQPSPRRFRAELQSATTPVMPRGAGHTDGIGGSLLALEISYA